MTVVPSLLQSAKTKIGTNNSIKINNTEKCFVNIEKKLKILNDEMV